MKILIVLLALTLIVGPSTQALGEFVPSQSGHTANLIKRSLCNTFGGCGAKRSIVPHFGSYKATDYPDEKKRDDANAKLISEILEDIIEHLQQDKNYKQGKYVMFVPKQTVDGSSYLQRVDADGNGGAVDLMAEMSNQRAANNVRATDDVY